MPRIFISHHTDPCLNLAMEELLARESTEEAVMLWRNEPSIIVGCHQNTGGEIDGEYVRGRGIHVVRRITGGGAVYHDLGNVNFSVISLEREWGPESAQRFTHPIVMALRELGVDAAFSGRNDILANGLKVSGCARCVPRGHTLFHGTLLFDTDLDVLARALRPDPDKIQSKGIKSVRARVGNIHAMLPPERRGMDTDAFIRHLQASLQTYFARPFSPLPDDLLEKARRLADAKYRTWEWNYGTSMEYDVHKRRVFEGGRIAADFNVRQNRIASLRFTGDFFGSLPIEPLVAALNGKPPSSSVILKALEEVPLENYISGISAEELASLLSAE